MDETDRVSKASIFREQDLNCGRQLLKCSPEPAMRFADHGISSTRPA